MRYKNRIIFGFSFAIALCYCLPWLALIEKARLQGLTEQNPMISARVVFLFASIFTTCTLLSYYNLGIGRTWIPLRQPFRELANMLVNVMLILAISWVSHGLAKMVFGIAGGKAYFIVYLIRNFSVAVVVILFVYVIELIGKLRREKIEVLMLRNKNAESELAALRNQIDPHFLFNTLTTLSGLARTKSSDTIPFIDHMSETFRYMLENRENKKVTVRTELGFLESYIFTIKKRFDQGIHVEVSVDHNAMNQYIPQFALQIAVENAIKHNVVSVRSVLHIKIVSKKDSISIINNLQKRNNRGGYGVGLQNLSQRYYLIAHKSITVKEEKGNFELTVPLL